MKQWRSRPHHQHAAKSPDELVFLRNVVRDMDIIEPKQIYANWLAANGETSKAAFVSQLIAAYTSLSEDDLPDFALADTCWARMVGGEMLGMLLRKSQHLSFNQRKQLRDVVFKLVEPSIVVRYCEEEDAHAVCLLGGRPIQNHGASTAFTGPMLVRCRYYYSWYRHAFTEKSKLEAIGDRLA